MGVAIEDYRWSFIGGNEQVGVFIHPYGKREFTSFCIVVDKNSNVPGGAYTSIAAQMTDGPTNDFVDGVARTIWVKNTTIGPQPFITVGLLSFTQTF